MKKSFLLGVGITHSTEDKIVAYVINSVQKKQESYYIVTPNPEMIVLANQNERFKTILNQARIALADGVGLLWASKILGGSLKTRTTGVDLMESLCNKIAGKPLTVGFLGGRVGVAEETAKCLQKKYLELQVVFASSEWQEDFARGPAAQASALVAHENFLVHDANPHRKSTKSTSFSANVHSENFVSSPRRKKSIDILFVAFGFPKQEKWMASHIGKVPVKVMIGVGGAFDYISGRVPRAPVFVRNLGFEWLFRLIVQPWRLKRQLALLEFIFLVFKEKAKCLLQSGAGRMV